MSPGTRVRRLVLAGLAAAVLVGAGGGALAWRTVGGSDAETMARVEREVRGQIAARLASLRAAAALVTARPDLLGAGAEGADLDPALFALLGTARGEGQPEAFAVTVYSPAGVALAWTGRASDIPQDRIAGPEAVFVGLETRSSSPLRLPRDPESFRARGFFNLFPCGEGAGYAGGIMSAAIDGACAAQALLSFGLERAG